MGGVQHEVAGGGHKGQRKGGEAHGGSGEWLVGCVGGGARVGARARGVRGLCWRGGREKRSPLDPCRKKKGKAACCWVASGGRTHGQGGGGMRGSVHARGEGGAWGPPGGGGGGANERVGVRKRHASACQEKREGTLCPKPSGLGCSALHSRERTLQAAADEVGWCGGRKKGQGGGGRGALVPRAASACTT